MTKYSIIALWVAFLLFMNTGRTVGMWGVETDWYGCYAPQADAFREYGTIPIDDFRGPLYQVTLGAVSILTGGDTWLAGQWINILCSALCLLLIWQLCKALKLSHFSTVVSCLALMLTPAFLAASVELGTDVFFLMITLAAIYAMVKQNAIFAGVMISLAILTRSNGFALIAPAILLYDKRWIPIVVFTFLAWGLYTLNATGDFFHNQNYLNTAALITESGRLEELWYGGGERVSGWFGLLSISTLVAVWNNAQSVIAGMFTKLWFFPASFIGLYGLARLNNSVPFTLALASIPLCFLIAFDVRYCLILAPLFALGLGVVCEPSRQSSYQ